MERQVEPISCNTIATGFARKHVVRTCLLAKGDGLTESRKKGDVYCQSSRPDYSIQGDHGYGKVFKKAQSATDYMPGSV